MKYHNMAFTWIRSGFTLKPNCTLLSLKNTTWPLCHLGSPTDKPRSAYSFLPSSFHYRWQHKPFSLFHSLGGTGKEMKNNHFQFLINSVFFKKNTLILIGEAYSPVNNRCIPEISLSSMPVALRTSTWLKSNSIEPIFFQGWRSPSSSCRSGFSKL